MDDYAVGDEVMVRVIADDVKRLFIAEAFDGNSPRITRRSESRIDHHLVREEEGIKRDEASMGQNLVIGGQTQGIAVSEGQHESGLDTGKDSLDHAVKTDSPAVKRTDKRGSERIPGCLMDMWRVWREHGSDVFDRVFLAVSTPIDMDKRITGDAAD